jgi:hypothetical protein
MGTMHAHRERVGAEHGEEECRRDHFLGAAVSLAPEERRELAVEEMPRHQAPHRLIAVEDAERGPVDDDSEEEPRDGARAEHPRKPSPR